VNLTINHG
jgi:putative ABC transport system ATP-binding protein